MQSITPNCKPNVLSLYISNLQPESKAQLETGKMVFSL